MEENYPHVKKRKRCPSPSDDSIPQPKHPLLESISQRFAQNRNEQNKRLNILLTKRETERAHANYIRQQVGHTPEGLRATSAAQFWAKKNGVKNDPLTNIGRNRGVIRSPVRNKNLTRGRTNIVSSPGLCRRLSNMAVDEEPHGLSDSGIQYGANASLLRAKRLSDGSSSPASSSLNNHSALTNSPGSDSSIIITSTPPPPISQSRNTNTHHTSTPRENTSSISQPRETGSISPVTARHSGTSNHRDEILIADETDNDSLILVSEQPATGSGDSGARPKEHNRSSGNRSNNADTQHSQYDSSSSNNGLSGASSFQDDSHQCHVLNCGAVFSSEGSLGHHMNLFKHSPCNPCLKARDCKLSPDPLCFQCPDCDREFPDAEECSKHMKAQNHSPYYPPLAVAGYMCAQCLYVFENFQACWQHLEQSHHKDICYPFADDIAVHSSERTAASAPVPIIQELVDDLKKKCESVAYRLQCLECSLNMENPGALRHHRLETNNQHMVSVLCDSNLVDIFASYLAGYTCNRCHRLFNGSIKNGARHECAKGVTGNIVENNVNSFFEFVKWCALTHIKSLEPKNPIPARNQPVAGTSSENRSSSPKSPKPAKTHRSQARAQSIVEVLSSSEEEEEEEVANKCIVLSETDDDVIEASKGATGGEGSKKKNKRKKKKKKKKVNNIEETNSAGEKCDIPVKRSTATTSVGTTETNRLIHAQDSFHKRASETQIPPTSHSSSQGNISASSSVSNHQSFRHPPPPYYHPGIMPHGSHMPFFAPIATRSQLQVAMENRPGNIIPQLPPPTQRPSSSRDRHQTRSPVEEMTNETRTTRDRSRSPLESSLITTANLTKMRNIIFLDLDNWRGFFSKLPRALPERTFVWAFFGGTLDWVEPRRCFVFDKMKRNGQFYLNERCGRTKDAADFAIVLNVGKMDERLPSDIAFTILSGDKGFMEVERQMKESVRKAVVINPHQAEQFSNEMIYTMVTSVTDT